MENDVLISRNGRDEHQAMHSVSEEVHPGVIYKWSSLSHGAPKPRARGFERNRKHEREKGEGAKKRIVEGYGERAGRERA